MAATVESIFDELQRINEKLDLLPGIIEVNGNQVRIVSLDELSETLGLIMAGEFRSGNLRAPGDSFSGVRIGYPGFYYPDTSTASSDLYNIVGADADTLQFGLRATDGVAVFGAGAVELDENGIQIAGGQSAFNTILWLDKDNPVGTVLGFEILAEIFAWEAEASTTAMIGNLQFHSHSNFSTDQSTASSGVLDSPGGLLFIADFESAAGLDMAISRMDLRITADTEAWGDGDQSDYFVRMIRYIGGDSGAATDSEDLSVYLFRFGGALSNPTLYFGEPWLTSNDHNPIDFSFFGLSTATPFLHLSGRADATIFGASDTSNLLLGVLGEKALTFASTATAGIEDPDNEMGKLWLDTDAELRLTDSGGEDWYVTKSTSTGGGSTGNTLPYYFSMTEAELDNASTAVAQIAALTITTDLTHSYVGKILYTAVQGSLNANGLTFYFDFNGSTFALPARSYSTGSTQNDALNFLFKRDGAGPNMYMWAYVESNNLTEVHTSGIVWDGSDAVELIWRVDRADASTLDLMIHQATKVELWIAGS